MGDISASVPQLQIPNYAGTYADAAQVPSKNALNAAQAGAITQETHQKNYAFAAGVIGDALYGVLQAPPEQREQAYQSAKSQLGAAGVDVSQMPPTFDPAYVNGALTKALGISKAYQMGVTRSMVGALSGGGMQLPPVPGQAQQDSAPPASQPPAPAASQPPATPQPSPPPPNALNATGNPPTGIPGAGMGLAAAYLMDPAAAAGAVRDQLAPQNIRPGSVYRNPATGVQFQVPELPEGVSYDPTTGKAGEVPGAAAAGSNVRQAAELGSKRGEQGGDYEAKIRDDGEAAQQHLAILGQMKQELAGITSFDPGTFGTLKGNAAKLFASVFGDKDKGTGADGSAANFQEFKKNSIQLALTQAKAMSSREAFQGVLFVQEGNPNFEMTRAGIQGIIGQMQGLDQFRMAKNQALSSWSGDPNKFEAYWQKMTDPTVFMFNNATDAQKQQMLSGLTKPEKIQFLNVYRSTRDNGWLPQ